MKLVRNGKTYNTITTIKVLVPLGEIDYLYSKRRNSTHKSHLAPSDYVMRSGRICWFGHVKRRDVNEVIRRVMEDMTGVGVSQDVALDGKEWRRRTRPTHRR